MTDGTDVGAEAVEEKMHGQLRGRAATTGELVSFEIGDNKVFGCHPSFADPAWGREELRSFEPYRQIALRPDGETAFVKPACGDANIAAEFAFRLRVARRNGVGSHAFVNR